MPSIENVITNNREAKNTKWDLRSDGRHKDRNIQMTQNSDLESHGRHKSKFCQQVQDSGENFPKLISTSSNQNNHCRENLVDFEQSDDDGYDRMFDCKYTSISNHYFIQFLQDCFILWESEHGFKIFEYFLELRIYKKI